MTTIQSTNQISPANERIYHQSYLVGDWKGTFSKTNQPVEFKVINIRGATAQVEYSHNRHTERGLADVNGNTISFGDVTIGTRNGQKAAIEFSTDTAKMTGILDKQAATPDQNKLVGTWTGSSGVTGSAVTLQVVSISGRDAQVKYTINGNTQQGTGDVVKNTVMFGKAQLTSNDGENGTAVFQVGHKTFSLSVKKFHAPSTSSTVNKLA